MTNFCPIWYSLLVLKSPISRSIGRPVNFSLSLLPILKNQKFDFSPKHFFYQSHSFSKIAILCKRKIILLPKIKQTSRNPPRQQVGQRGGGENCENFVVDLIDALDENLLLRQFFLNRSVLCQNCH